MKRYLSLTDFERGAQKRLPRPLFHYIQGGVEQDLSVKGNRTAFDNFSFVTRVLTDVSTRSIEMPLLGHTYSAPFGIAPMGICALDAYRGDLVLARAARAANVPMIVSATSLIPMEDIHEANPDAWFQAYLRGETDKIDLLIERVERAGFRTLVATVDIPVKAYRENDIRVGFTTPLRPSFRLVWDGLLRPRWLVEVFLQTLIRHGIPHFENSTHERGLPIISAEASRDFSGQSRLTWAHIRHVRQRWRGRFILKGILSPDDARLARECGVDAIIASNHGGRQLDGALPPLLLLPELLEAARGLPVMIDGGFRRGGDVVKAIALGASFVFVGRPFAYAASVGKVRGVLHGIELLRREIDRTMGMLGYTQIGEIDSLCLRRNDGAALPLGPPPG
jgi:L-lactate dehydrogenase (cytochrome)